MEITLEARRDGHCYIFASAEMPGLGKPVLDNLVGLRASIHLEASSPSAGSLDIVVNGSITIPSKLIPAEYRILLLTPELINPYLQSRAEKYLQRMKGWGNLPLTLADLEIENLRVTEFSWEEPQATVSLTATLHGTVFENQQLLNRLPLKVDAALDVSETTMRMGVEFQSLTTDGGFGMIATTEKTSLEFEGSFELPRVGDGVRWEFPPEIQAVYSQEQSENLKVLLRKHNIEMTLYVPAGAEATGLPTGYTRTCCSFMWSGEEAADALAMLATGEASPDITYAYVYMPPPTMTSSAPPEVVGEPNLTITGTAQANSTVRVYTNGKDKTTTKAGPDGSFSADVTLDEGFNSIRVSAADEDGNESSRVLYGATIYSPQVAPPTPQSLDLVGAGIAVLVAAVVGVVAIVLHLRRAPRRRRALVEKRRTRTTRRKNPPLKTK